MTSNTPDNFYLFLISNAEKDNHIGDFRVPLNHPISLEGQYEVALTHIMFPLTFDNITERRSEAEYFENTILCVLRESNRNVKLDVEEVRIPPAYYNDSKVLVDKINEAVLTQLKPRIPDMHQVLSYDPITRRCSVKLRPKLKQLGLSFKLAFHLGLPKQMKEDVPVAPYPMHTASDFVFIYCDIVDMQMVSNVMAPLLRIVSPKGVSGEMCEITFDRPQYLRLLKNNFDRVKVEFKNDLNEIVDFHSGKISFTLHFRRRR